MLFPIALVLGLSVVLSIADSLDAAKAAEYTAPNAPGLSMAETREYQTLRAAKALSPRSAQRLAELQSRIDADMAGMGLSPEDVPALR